MVSVSQSLAAAISDLRSVCASSNSRLIEDAIVPEDIRGIVSVRVTTVELLDLIRHIRPKVVFFLAPNFDPEREILDTLFDDDDESDLDDQEREEREKIKRHFGVKKLANRFKPFRGEVQFLLTSFFDGIVGYYSYERAEWLEEFNFEIENIRGQLDEQERREFVIEEESRRAEISKAMEKILRDPRFSKGRPSRAKRLYLASMLFPEFVAEERKKIVEQAEMKLWASAGGDE